jgi:hypothetical protein
MSFDNIDPIIIRTVIGWKVCRVDVQVVTTPDGSTQTLGNGEVIPLQYALNNDGTLTIPYLATVVGIEVLTPFIIDNGVIMNEPYDSATGTFDNSVNGGFIPDVNIISFNASLPLYF